MWLLRSQHSLPDAHLGFQTHLPPCRAPARRQNVRFPRSLRTLSYLGAIVLHWARNFKCYANSCSCMQHVIHLQSKQSFIGIMTELKIGQW